MNCSAGRNIWTIGPLEAFLDNFTDPAAAPEGTRRIEAGGLAKGERWPLYHASEADPDGGYRPRTYSAAFRLDSVPSGGALLEVGIIANTPRLGFLEAAVNGSLFRLHFQPLPSDDPVIKPKHCLHAAIYSRDRGTLYLPPHVLRAGENTIAFTARDGGAFERVENRAAVQRLDRMADACGFIYEELSLAAVPGIPPFQCRVIPSPFYTRSPESGNGEKLVEHCRLEYRLDEPAAGFRLHLESGGWNTVLDLPCTDTPARTGPEAGKIISGWARFAFTVPDGEGPVRYRLTRGALPGAGTVCAEGSFERKRKWTVYAAPQAHTDIGYTHRQWEVAERHCRNIDTALETLKTDGDAFSFILDSSWPLEGYLSSRDGGKREEILEQVRGGKFGIPANYVDLLSQFAGLEDLVRNGEFTETFLHGTGLAADRVDMVDVASAPLSYPTILAGMGVKYFFHADNQDRGPFRLNGGLHRKSPFYWQGPDGSRILVWLSKMYCELKKVCGSPPCPEAAERGLEMWLAEYDRADYAPDAVMLYGQEADNTDLDPRAVSFVRLWNERYAYPRLVPCDGSTFLRSVEERFAHSFPVYRGDGGAYWEDGAASSAAASGKVRQAQALLLAAEILESFSVIHGRGRRFDLEAFGEAWKQVLLYDEHTWGSFLSDTDYGSLLQRDQWTVKEHMAERALREAERLLHAAAVKCALEWNNEGREAVVHNTSDSTGTGAVTVEIGIGEEVFDPSGNRLPQRTKSSTATQKVVEFWAEDIPPFSWRRFPLRQTDASPVRTLEHDCGAQFETPYYRLRFDFARGAIGSLFDRDLEKEVAGAGRFGLGEFLYVAGGEGSGLLGNHSDKAPSRLEPIRSFEYVSRRCERTPWGTSVVISGKVPHGTLEVEYFLHDRLKRIDIGYVYEKEEVLSPEAAYVAFPFALEPDASVLSDSHVGWVNWNADTLPGACREWLPLQTSVLLRGGFDVHLASPDVFLFTVNDIVRGRWPRELDLSGNTVFSYVLNNYWRTNYKAAQGGRIAWRYSLTSAPSIPFQEASRLGRQGRTGLYCHRMSYQEFRKSVPAVYDGAAGGTFAVLGSDQAAVSTVTKARRAEGWIVRLVETSGSAADAEIAFPGKAVGQAFRVDHLERPLGEMPVVNGRVRVRLEAWSLVSVRVMIASGEDPA